MQIYPGTPPRPMPSPLVILREWNGIKDRAHIMLLNERLDQRQLSVARRTSPRRLTVDLKW